MFLDKDLCRSLKYIYGQNISSNGKNIKVQELKF